MNITVIGCGNLGKSFVQGLVSTKAALKPGEITASDPDKDKLKEVEELGVKTTISNTDAAENSDIVFIAVKPGLVGEVLDELELSKDIILVSLAAGVTKKTLREHTEAPVVRVMPNIGANVGEMASAYSPGENVSEDEEKTVRDLLDQIGEVVKVEEELMDAVTGLSGSGPAYVFVFIKALRDAGEDLGLPEEKALKLAAQTVKSGGELVLKSGNDLDDLIDIVCSPKGTTIEGVKVLEDEDVEESLKKAVKAAAERSEELSR